MRKTGHHSDNQAGPNDGMANLRAALRELADRCYGRWEVRGDDPRFADSFKINADVETLRVPMRPATPSQVNQVLERRVQSQKMV